MLNLLTLPQNLAEEALDGPILGMRKQAGEGLVTQPRSFSNERDKLGFFPQLRFLHCF